MANMVRDVAYLADVFFNGRSTKPEPKQSSVTLPELIRRKVSFVMVDRKLYKFTVEPVDLEK